MKKIFLSVLICLFAFFTFAEDEKKVVGFDVGICSGLPFYGSSYVTTSNDRVFDKDYGRIIIGTDADITFRVGNPLKIVLGTDFLADFIWCGNDYSNHLDYAFWGGVKFYPGIGGLNGSLGYVLGCRTDFVNNNVDDSIVRSSSWGNGFRVGVEYDFLYNTSHKCMPAIGTYYRMMPRGGDEYDNILAVYFNFSF